MSFDSQDIVESQNAKNKVEEHYNDEKTAENNISYFSGAQTSPRRYCSSILLYASLNI